jgi:gas vesicle protein
MYREEGTGASFALGLFAGAVIGAGVALLFAPKTGTETRELLGQQYRGLADRVSDATETLRQQARERGQQISSQLSDRMSSITDRVTSAADRATATADRTSPTASSEWNSTAAPSV